MTTEEQDLLDELGIEREPVPEMDADAEAALAALRDKVCADLKETQGPWRQASVLKRYWPMIVALLAGLGFVFAMPVGQLNGALTAAVIAAAVTALVCFGAVFITPTRPGLSEKLSLLGIGLAVVSFGLQIYGGNLASGDAFHLDMALKCSAKLALGAAVPLALLIYGLRRTGFPVRILHAVALTAAALSLSGVGIWRTCAPDEPMHFTLSHVVIPALLLPLAALVVWKLARAKGTMV